MTDRPNLVTAPGQSAERETMTAYYDTAAYERLQDLYFA